MKSARKRISDALDWADAKRHLSSSDAFMACELADGIRRLRAELTKEQKAHSNTLIELGRERLNRKAITAQRGE